MNMCFNWKVLAGLGAVGAGFFLVAPQLALAALPLLLFAACPLSMILMMRGMGGKKGGHCATDCRQGTEPTGVVRTGDEQLADLRTQLAGLQTQQERLSREIARLEERQTPALREAEAIARTADERAQDVR